MPDLENPFLSVFNPFLTSKNFRVQMEKVGKNKGFVNASFEAMMKAVGWQGGQAWCMYYCKLVYMQFFSFDREFIAKYFTGGSQVTPNNIINLNAKGDKRYIFVNTNTPQIGDIFCLENVPKDGMGHVGIITEVFTNTKVKTIEGNTSLKGVREGDGVFELNRNLEIGVKSGSKRMRGYIRRNFTQDELSKVYFDETEKTLKFR